MDEKKAKLIAIPVNRVNTIMKSSSDVETVSKESSVLMAKAAELFLRTLTIEGYNNITYTGKLKKLDYKHLANVVHNDDKYRFLRDIMPKKITVLQYKEIIAKKKAAAEQESEDQEESSSSSSSSEENDDVNNIIEVNSTENSGTDEESCTTDHSEHDL